MLWCQDLRAAIEAGGSPAPPADAAIAALDHVPELEALCLALSSGQLLLLETDGQPAVAAHGQRPSQPPPVEEVGAVGDGLAGGAWSPDGEVLALASASASLLLMNKARAGVVGGWGGVLCCAMLCCACATATGRAESARPAAAALQLPPAGWLTAPTHPATPAPRQPQNWELLAEVPLLQHRGEGGGPATAAAPDPRHALAPGSVAITWRGDGRYFATASMDAPGAASATVRVWERDTAELHAMAQPESTAAALLPAAAWQPNGRHLYVAATQRADVAAGAAEAQPQLKHQTPLPHEAEQARLAAAEGIAHVGAWKRELRRRQAARAAAAPGGAVAARAEGGGAGPEARVLLFERNGLQHGGFELPPSPWGGAAPEQLAWSPCSDFLAAVLAQADEDGAPRCGRPAGVAGGSCRPAWPRLPRARCRPLHPAPAGAGLPQQVLQLWHRSNWHWYLKAERRYRHCSALHAAWDQGGGGELRLQLVTAEGDYEQVGGRSPSWVRACAGAPLPGRVHSSTAEVSGRHRRRLNRLHLPPAGTPARSPCSCILCARRP